MADKPECTITTQGSIGTNALSSAMQSAFESALREETKLPDPIFLVDGFSGRKFRMFLNNLFSLIDNPRYLEVGVFKGGSFIPAVYGNMMTATALDNWAWEGSDINRFKAYLQEFGESATVTVINKDFREVDYSLMGPFNVLFYDGSHAEKDQLDGVRLPAPAMDDQYIAIVDDWNFDRVRKGTFDGFDQAQCRIDHMIELRTSQNGALPARRGPKSDWHNGMFAAVVSKIDTSS